MAKVNKKELGKGIRALLGEPQDHGENIDEPAVDKSVPLHRVPIDQIEINPFQPRNQFDQSALQELAESISTFGLIQPITLRRLNDKKFQLIAGERRLRAAKIAGLTDVPSFIREANDQEMLEMALVENIQREELNAMEVAISYQRLIEECKLTHEVLADRIGKNRSTITNYVRLLKLPPALQKALKTNHISMGHARSLLGLPDVSAQLTVLKLILEKGLSVRATEKLVQEYSREKSVRKQSATGLLPLYQQTVDHLIKQLGTKVEMKRNRRGAGRLVIYFDSDTDLNEILDYFDCN